MKLLMNRFVPMGAPRILIPSLEKDIDSGAPNSLSCWWECWGEKMAPFSSRSEPWSLVDTA